jgi:hypothetical protein
MSIETKGMIQMIHDQARNHIEQYDREVGFKMAEIVRLYTLRNFEQQLLATTKVDEMHAIATKMLEFQNQSAVQQPPPKRTPTVDITTNLNC